MSLAGALLALVQCSAVAASSVTLAWDPSVGTNIAGYKIYYGTSSHAYTNTTDVHNVTNAPVSGLINGAVYYFAATAYDTSGLESDYSTEVAYTNIAPTITLTSPANGSGYGAPATINLAATVTANGHTITAVQFYNGTTLLGQDASAPYTFSWTNVPAGSYSLTAQAVYDSGSTVASTAASVTVTNLSAPTIALTAPANGASYAAPATITLTAAVTANGHTITAVQFYSGTTLLGQDSSSPYRFSWTSVSAGSYSLTARAVYDSGSTVASPAANVTVTNLAAPTIALTAPANGASFAAPATISLAATVTANGHTITAVQFYNGGTLLGQDSSAPYSFSWTNISAGSYSLTAQAVYDSGSTVASPAANVTVTNLPAPVIALTAPANGASYAAPATVSLAATVTANGHTITAVQFYNGATLLGQDASAPYSFSWANVSAGTYSLTARAVYDSGSTVASGAASVTVTNPPAPTIALTAPANGASYATPATINLAATVTANGHTITAVQFYNGTNLLGQDTSAPYTFSWTNVSTGSYSLSAQAVYDSGSIVASGSASVTVTNSSAPAIALTVPADGESYAAPATIDLAASVADNGHTVTSVQFYEGTNLLGEATAAPYSFSWTNVGPGTYSLTAQASYDSGSTIVSAPANVTVAAARPPDAAPAISAIHDQTMTTNRAQLLVRFTISGADIAASNLLFSADSTNPTLLPTNNIVFAPGDTNCTVTLIPSSGQTGEVDITLTISDGSVSTNTSFHLSVTDQVAWQLWWQHAGGTLAAWSMNQTNQLVQPDYLNPAGPDSTWRLAGAGDLNGDGGQALVFENRDGRLAAWFMDDLTRTQAVYLTPGRVDPSWKIVGVGDFNGDGYADLLWESNNGALAVWFMQGATMLSGAYLDHPPVGPNWRVVATADLDGDGQTDLLWEDSNGTLAAWFMNGTTFLNFAYLNPSKVEPGWRIVAAMDIDGDGQPDLLWEHSGGALAYWLMNGTNMTGGGYLKPFKVDSNWRIVGVK